MNLGRYHSVKWFENSYQTDVHFNYDHESPEVAILEMWNDLAQKFFRMHQADLRPRFHQKWAGTDSQKGRFEKEIKKLEKNFNRKCSSKNLITTPLKSDKVSRRSVDSYDEFAREFFPRAQRSAGQPSFDNNPGHRMRHIVRNVEKWTEDYLTGCSNQKIVIARWKRFTARWENEMAKNPIFAEEFKKEEAYLKETRSTRNARPCGRIYKEFGLHGEYRELLDSSHDDPRLCAADGHGFNDMSHGLCLLTHDWNDQLMSMIPYSGKIPRISIPGVNKEFKGAIFGHTKITTNMAILLSVMILLDVLSLSVIGMVF